MADLTLTLQLNFPGEKSTTTIAQVREWSTVDRAKRAAMGLAVVWACALGALFTFIPILHLLLALSLFVSGPIVAAYRFNERRRIVSMKGSCPRCKVDREFTMDLRFNGKRTFSCAGCGNLIEIEEAPVAAAPVAAAVVPVTGA